MLNINHTAIIATTILISNSLLMVIGLYVINSWENKHRKSKQRLLGWILAILIFGIIIPLISQII